MSIGEGKANRGSDGKESSKRAKSSKSSGRSGRSRSSGKSNTAGRSKSARQEKPKTQVPEVIRRRLIIKGECDLEYYELEKWLIGAINPRDAVEILLAHDMARYTWEAQRAWKVRTEFICDLQLEAAMGDFAKYLMDHARDEAKKKELQGPAAVEEELRRAREQLGRILKGDKEAFKASPHLAAAYYNATLSGSLPHVYLDAIDRLERLDEMIVVWESRRDQCLRQIERRRDEQYERVNKMSYDGLRALDLKDKLDKAAAPPKGSSSRSRKVGSDAGGSTLQ